MPVVAIVNRKGGSGKSTLATNLAAWCASKGWRVMLGDIDRQQSIKSWLSRRGSGRSPITTWAIDNGKVFRAPKGTTHVVLDTPGALYGHDLSKLIVWVDALLVPIGPSVFDWDASATFMEEVRRHPKVKSGRCKVAAIGMRWPKDRIHAWESSIHHDRIRLLTVIPDLSCYRTLLEAGSSVFDAPGEQQLSEWAPLLQWIDRVWKEEAEFRAMRAHGPTITNSEDKHSDHVASPRQETPKAVQLSGSKSDSHHSKAHWLTRLLGLR